MTITAVITDSDKKHKYTMNDFTLIPRWAASTPPSPSRRRLVAPLLKLFLR